MPDDNDTSQEGMSGVLVSARARAGALRLSGALGQHEKT